MRISIKSFTFQDVYCSHEQFTDRPDSYWALSAGRILESKTRFGLIKLLTKQDRASRFGSWAKRHGWRKVKREKGATFKPQPQREDLRLAGIAKEEAEKQEGNQ